MATATSSSFRPGLVKAAVLVAVTVMLYVAREICVPFALAILLAFLLEPVVTRLQKWWSWSRAPAVSLVMAGVLAIILLVGWMTVAQFVQLAEQLPQYRTTVHEKLAALHTKPGGTFDQLNRTFNDYAQEVESLGSQTAPSQTAAAQATSEPATESAAYPAAQPTSEPATENAAPAATQTALATLPASIPKAIAVTVTKPQLSGFDLLRTMAMGALRPLLVLGIVLILTLFILIQWQDMRDRMLRLIGRGQIQMTTKTIDDAGGRVSHYLLLQMAVNIVYGACVFGGLLLIGVPNSPLWGLLAAILRFLPYFGVPVAAIPPIILSFVTGHGFMGVLFTLALYAVLEILTGYIIEPWLYGSRTGISPLAILASALFWGWIWGPVGLLLSTPLTVCLAVIGRHVPALGFLHVIFGDEPALTPDVRFYQRLLAGDQDEATEVAEGFLQEHSEVQLYDDVLLPALLLAERDRRRGEMDDDTRQNVYGFLGALLDDVAQGAADAANHTGPVVLCIPAGTEADDLAARMLAAHLSRRGARVTRLGVESLAGEGVGRAQELHPDVICISAMPPQAILHARYLAKRLRAVQEQAKIVVGLWHAPEVKDRLPPALVGAVATTISGAADQIILARSPDAHPELAPALPQ